MGMRYYGKFKGTKWIMVMQKLHIFLPPHHHHHHHHTFEGNFCILNGWANPVMNLIFNWFIAPYVPEETQPHHHVEWREEGMDKATLKMTHYEHKGTEGFNSVEDMW